VILSFGLLSAAVIGNDGHGVIIQAGKMLDKVVAGIVPNVDPEGKIGLGLHGQVRLDLPAPRIIYTPCCGVLSASPKS
jgi:hypothetical protein